MHDGKEIDARKLMDFGEEYSVHTADGKFITVPKKDVKSIEPVAPK